MRRSCWHKTLFFKFIVFCGVIALLGLIPPLESSSMFILRTIGGLIGTLCIIGGALAVPLLIYSFLIPQRR